ncbi:MAG: hypothetical protein IJ774_09445 [Selenomonadaceae bacterium]|nr:hypothetical protein [Selenomonadaceae bacterium]MBR1806589.1 hypothetical protein [Selenomonadaceae bacterium]
MADYYRIETSNQTVTGSAAGELFELVPYTNSLTNVIINAAGGNDTIQVSSSNANISATIMNLDPSSVIDLDRNRNYYYTTEADGIRITDITSRVNLKLLGTTNSAILNNSNNNFTTLDQQTTADGQRLSGKGKGLNNSFVVNHSNCYASGNSGDDLIIARGNKNSLYGSTGDDTIIITGNYNTAEGDDGQDFLIVGGNNNSVNGGGHNDTFEAYSYTAGGSNNTLKGGGGYDTYMLSTGLVGLDAAAVGTNLATTVYNPYTTDTVSVTITDAISGDSYYMRDWGNFGINASTTSDGVVVSSTSGRINILMAGQRNWSAVKDNLITLDNAQGLVGTYTLEQAVGLAQSGPVPPAGVFTNGDYLLASSSFVGNLIMSSSSANYTNNQIVTIDATQNYQVGMQLGGNSNGNAIYAGQGGNILWGGDDTATDYLFGGAGTDVFQVGKTDGNDAVLNAGTDDVIHLYDVNVDDIISYAYDANTIALGLNSGNVISVVNGDAISPTFTLANGQSYRFNRAAYAWQGA